jgi:hypothetical protein
LNFFNAYLVIYMAIQNPVAKLRRLLWISLGVNTLNKQLFDLPPFQTHLDFYFVHSCVVSQDSIAGIARGQSSSPGRVKNFLFSASSRPALGSTQPPTSTGGSFPWGGGADHSPPNIAKVKKMWIYTFTRPYTFIMSQNGAPTAFIYGSHNFQWQISETSYMIY